MAKFILSLCLVFVGMLLACHKSTSRRNKELSVDSFSVLKEDRYWLNAYKIRANIDELMIKEGMPLSIDRHIRNYYSEGNPFIWINRLGVYKRVDTLLCILRGAKQYGISLKMLHVKEIEEDLERIQKLKIPDAQSVNSINDIMARLECNLTKAYIRYLVGLRFGFINPDNLYNNIESCIVDSTAIKFRQLSSLRIERPSNSFFKYAVNKAVNDSIRYIFQNIHPKNELYAYLLKRLNNNNLTHGERLKTLCNIERCRWRYKILSGKETFSKYVEVNIPSYSLRAVNYGKVMPMRVCCGAIKSKSPILTSWIMRMDVNPQWIIPKSISKGIIDNHAYMRRMGIFVFDKKEGKLSPEQASYNKIINGEQYLIQSGGKKNSLGRIIFRFKNNFSVFLHGAPSQQIFANSNRAISHGCIRLERPYDLAVFLLGETEKDLIEKLKYSITVDYINDKDSLKERGIDKESLVNYINVNPPVPLFITYYTIYYGTGGKISDCQDIYGYDDALITKLRPFVE